MKTKNIKSANHKKTKYLRELFENRYLYLLMLPALIFYAVFAYAPMYGLLMAFKDYNATLGVWGSEWVGLKHFKNLMGDPYFLYVLRNTLVMSFSRIIICFPVPIALAIIFNEMRGTKLKRTLQTVYTFPHFLSWVVLSGIVISALDFSGPLNNLLNILGFERRGFLGNEKMFKPIIYLTQIWKEAGWSSITYLAAIVGIDMQYYEAADLDGASRFQKIWHITLPCIRPTILVLLILQIGTLMTGASFDQVFNLSNPAVQKAGDILDTYIYRITFQTDGDFSFSTAVGFFMSVVNFSLVIAANWFSKKLDGVGILD